VVADHRYRRVLLPGAGLGNRRQDMLAAEGGGNNMRRIITSARPNWIERADEVGFTYHSLGQTPADSAGAYWFEDAAYEFTAAEIDCFEAATTELHGLCMEAVAYIVQHPNEMDAFRIPHHYRDYIAQSWIRKDPHWMGRFDLAFDPISDEIKMLEYNADTPTLVIETALMQWFWLQDKFPAHDQFNFLHERLLAQIREIGSRMRGETLYFAGLLDYPEEGQHIGYFMDLAKQAGISARSIHMHDIGWSATKGFVDLENKPIRFLHKLYPWEWIASEKFGEHIPLAGVGIVEPPWKMLLSNKAILPLLWRLFPNHPHLLAAGWSASDVGPNFIRKPILAREGANMELVMAGREPVVTDGSYGNSPAIYQEAVYLPIFDGQHVVLGSWVVGDRAAGLIVRESDGPIVMNTSRIVPHFFAP
jgi:glutathionylspermidine synthase